MEGIESDITCEKCGERMLVLPDTEWQLWEVRTVDAICPNCLHTRRIRTILVKGEDK